MIPQSTQGSKVVLVVEDEAEVREILREALEAAGYAVLVASDGEEALQVYQQHAGSIDLVVTDVLMPRMTGSDLVKSLWRSQPALKVLFISGYADEKTAAAYGFRGPLLRKPFTPDVLCRKVREVLEAPP
jgi:CheY-like chemotaxis protein